MYIPSSSAYPARISTKSRRHFHWHPSQPLFASTPAIPGAVTPGASHRCPGTRAPPRATAPRCERARRVRHRDDATRWAGTVSQDRIWQQSCTQSERGCSLPSCQDILKTPRIPPCGPRPYSLGWRGFDAAGTPSSAEPCSRSRMGVAFQVGDAKAAPWLRSEEY